MPAKKSKVIIKDIEPTKSKKYDSDDDIEEFQNSEDEYAQSGGEDSDDDDDNDSDTGDDATLDLDPDDEKVDDDDEHDKYDPINDIDEPEDSDSDIGLKKDEDENEVEEDLGDDDLADDEGDNEIEDIAENDEQESIDESVLNGESKTCHLKNLNQDFIVLDEDDSNAYGKMNYEIIPDEDRVTGNYMTYYEMVRIIGCRAQQFNFGAPPLISGITGLPPAQMAYLELLAKMTPYIIRRRLPNKKYEFWKISELELIHIIHDDFFVPGDFDLKDFIYKMAKNKTI